MKHSKVWYLVHVQPVPPFPSQYCMEMVLNFERFVANPCVFPKPNRCHYVFKKILLPRIGLWLSMDQNVLFERYFLVRRSCHVPSFVDKFKKPFSQYTLILISRFCMPNPLKSLGVHSMFQLVSLCFFLCL